MATTTAIVATSPCERFVVRADEYDKEALYVVWDVQQKEHVRLGEVPRWSSPFFEARRGIVFVPQPDARKPLLAASHERTRVALFQLDGTLVRATNRIKDYVTSIELVRDGTLLVIHCNVWQPV
jgi:hypothetical protein